MTEVEHFEELKIIMIDKYADYINKVRELSFEDLQDFTKRDDLRRSYSLATISHVNYRDFLFAFPILSNNKKLK